MKSVTSIATKHSVARLEIEVSQRYDVFCEQFEKAVPPIDQPRIADFVKRQAPWQDVLDDAAANAPLGFCIVWRLDVFASMALAGNTTSCTEYLMGNVTIAERMFRLDPMVMLYVPLRVLIYAEQHGPTTFVIEKPSSVLASLQMQRSTLSEMSSMRSWLRSLDIWECRLRESLLNWMRRNIVPTQ